MLVMSEEQLLQALADAFEQFITYATETARRGLTHQRGPWGPREYVAHLAGWEIMATVRVPNIAAGMPPLEFTDEAQQTVMNDAINATIVAMIGDQSLASVCGILRDAYRRDIEMLRKMDNSLFRPGNYVYERTRNVIEHCEEHRQDLASMI